MLLAVALAADIAFVGRAHGSFRADSGLAVLRAGYTHFFTAVEYGDNPVPVLELYQGVSQLGGALEIGSEGHWNLEVDATYFRGDLGAWGSLAAGETGEFELGGLIFLNDDLVAAASFELYSADDESFGVFRFGGKYIIYLDEVSLFLEGGLGPVFESERWSFDVSGTARYFFTNEVGVGVKFSTYEKTYLSVGEYYLDSGVSFKGSLGVARGKAFLELGVEYRF